MDKVKLKERPMEETQEKVSTPGRALDVAAIRKDFPILHRSVNGKQLVYLDNAATTQKPSVVIDALLEYYSSYNANIHRAVHALSDEATQRYESARSKVAGFIGAQPGEIIFTRNATEALNIVAYSLGAKLRKGDEIVATLMEHHSNIVPWQMLEKNGVKVKYVDIDENGKLRTEQYDELITEKTKIVAVSHVSNVLGTVNDVAAIARRAHDAGALVVVDAAQCVPHMPVDAKQLGADFLAFSGHKMCGPTGIGVLYGRRELLEDMAPFIHGGDMIKEVALTGTTFNDVPWRFEAGTASIADAIALGVAVDYLSAIGMQSIRNHEEKLTEYALERLSEISGIEIYGPQSAKEKAGVLSFNVGDMHSHDVATLLDREGIAIRSGHNCAMPLMKRLGVASVARASFYLYNTTEEVDKLADAIEEAKGVFRIG